MLSEWRLGPKINFGPGLPVVHASAGDEPRTGAPEDAPTGAGMEGSIPSISRLSMARLAHGADPAAARSLTGSAFISDIMSGTLAVMFHPYLQRLGLLRKLSSTTSARGQR